MKTVSVAVLGAGIAGLSFAAQVTKIPHVSLKVFEKEEFAGGRIFSRELGHGIVADLGANIIEF
jgi:predicted NAD/FAD-dependent oxidoreductase